MPILQHGGGIFPGLGQAWPCVQGIPWALPSRHAGIQQTCKEAGPACLSLNLERPLSNSAGAPESHLRQRCVPRAVCLGVRAILCLQGRFTAKRKRLTLW